MIFNRQKFFSEKNNLITVERFFGNISISVGGTEQSGSYISSMWRSALRHIPKRKSVRQVLVLGLGGGNVINEINKKFPDAYITVIEWDPVMIDLSKKLGFFSLKKTPEIIEGDATKEIHAIHKKFDLIIVDLFNGKNPSPELSSYEMVSGLSQLLEPSGCIILNVYLRSEIISSFKDLLSIHAMWKYKCNTLALLSHFGQGKEGDVLPDSFVHQTQSSRYLSGAAHEYPPTLVGDEKCLGVRSTNKFFASERYVCDIEPSIEKYNSTRFIIWQPVTRTDKPAGWSRFPADISPSASAFLELSQAGEYWNSWTDRAKRSRKKWLQSTEYEIDTASLDDFCGAYRQSGTAGHLVRFFTGVLKKHYTQQSEDVRIFVIRSMQTREIVAGLATVDMPDISQSLHLVSFVHPALHKTGAGVGLMDHWVAHCIQNNIRIANFGTMWVPGNPSDWIGFTQFKEQFNPYIVRYPRPLFKIVFKDR